MLALAAAPPPRTWPKPSKRRSKTASPRTLGGLLRAGQVGEVLAETSKRRWRQPLPQNCPRRAQLEALAVVEVSRWRRRVDAIASRRRRRGCSHRRGSSGAFLAASAGAAAESVAGRLGADELIPARLVRAGKGASARRGR